MLSKCLVIARSAEALATADGDPVGLRRHPTGQGCLAMTFRSHALVRRRCRPKIKQVAFVQRDVFVSLFAVDGAVGLQPLADFRHQMEMVVRNLEDVLAGLEMKRNGIPGKRLVELVPAELPLDRLLL